MQKQVGRILSIVLSATLCISACKCNQKKNPAPAPTPVSTPAQAPVQAQTPTQPTAPIALPIINEKQVWASKIIAQYPEVVWLTNGQVLSTEEGHATGENSFSELLYNQKFVEFDRSMLSFYCLKLILDGSDKAYQEFTAAQPEKIRLSRESFQELHIQGKSLLTANYQGLSSDQMQQAMEVALALSDMGKTEKGRALFKVYGVTAPDSNDFYAQALEVLKNHSHLCRSFRRFSYPAKLLLIKVANLINCRELLQLERGPSLLTKLKTSHIAATDPTALSFTLFVQTCRIAATLGHVNNTSSIIYTQQTHLAMQAVATACRTLSDPTKSELDAYNSYVSFRASQLGFDPSDLELTRIAAMLRLFTPEEGAALKNGILQLSSQDQQLIMTYFGEETSRPLTDMSAVLINLANNTQLGSAPTERLSQAAIYGLPFITKVLQHHPETPLNFSTIARVAKTSPHLLRQNRFQIGPDGTVTLQ